MDLILLLEDAVRVEGQSELCVRVSLKESTRCRFKRSALAACDERSGSCRFNEEIVFPGSHRSGSLVVDVWTGVDIRASDLVGKLVLPLRDLGAAASVVCPLLSGELRMRAAMEESAEANEASEAERVAEAVAADVAAESRASHAATASSAPVAGSPGEEEKASFRFAGQRARPRKGVEEAFKVGETYLKPPGSCKTKWRDCEIGVEVECCEDCNIYVLDVCAQVQVSDCRNCRVVVGPTAGSVFLLNCVGCTVSVVARQLRLRDCADCDLRVFMPEREALIVETSHDLRVGKWELTYPGLAQQLSLAGFNSRGPNFWSKVYDFSPNEDGPSNWSLLQGAALDKGVELRLAPQGLCGGRVEEVDCMPPKGLWAEGAAATDGAQNDGHGDSANDSAAAKAPGSATPRKPESYLDDYESDEDPKPRAAQPAPAEQAADQTPGRSFRMDDYDDVEEIVEEDFDDDFDDDDDDLPLPGEGSGGDAKPNGAKPDGAKQNGTPVGRETQLICDAVAGAAAETAWAQVHAFVQQNAAPHAAMGAEDQQQLHEEYQALLEPRLTELVESLDLPLEDFVAALARADPDELPIAPENKVIALEICALDSPPIFSRLMQLEAEAAAHPLRRAALGLQADDEWQEEVRAYMLEHAPKFAEGAKELAEGGVVQKQLTWTVLHQDYQTQFEDLLEEALDRLSPSVDAQSVLETLADGTQDVVATPLPAEAMLPLRAFADYAAFEEMMLTIAPTL